MIRLHRRFANFDRCCAVCCAVLRRALCGWVSPPVLVLRAIEKRLFVIHLPYSTIHYTIPLPILPSIIPSTRPLYYLPPPWHHALYHPPPPLWGPCLPVGTPNNTKKTEKMGGDGKQLVYSYAWLASKFWAMCCAVCCAVLREVLRALENQLYRNLSFLYFFLNMLRQVLREFFPLDFYLYKILQLIN